MYRSALVQLAPFAAVALTLTAVASFFLIFISLGLPPCSQPSTIHTILRWSVPISFVAAAGLIVRLMFKGGWRSTAFALFLPVITVAAYTASKPYEAVRQNRCSAQSMQQAMASCRAAASSYRLSKDQYGYDTLTLVAPGTTDAAWDCLWRWSLNKGSLSLEVDESVYEAARRRAAAPNK